MYKLIAIALIGAVIGAGSANAASLIEPRIIGGEKTDIAKHPYLCSVRFRQTQSGPYYHMCAGSIYSERVIITGAQCLMNQVQDDHVMVVVGANTRNGTDGMPYPAAKLIAHPNYSYLTVDYDIGIIILDVPLTFNRLDARPITILPTRPAVGRLGTLPGWGYREEFGWSGYYLEDVQVPIVSTADCENAYEVGDITPRMICAGYIHSGGKDGCQGDTSGPLVFDGQLIGLLSWGLGCGRPGFPSVYTYVPALQQWIDDTIAANID